MSMSNSMDSSTLSSWKQFEAKNVVLKYSEWKRTVCYYFNSECRDKSLRSKKIVLSKFVDDNVVYCSSILLK